MTCVTSRSVLSCSRDTLHRPILDVEPEPAQLIGDVRAYRGRDQDLLRLGGDQRQLFPATDVQLGEHVIQYQDR